MKVAACTIVAKNYLPFARVLMSSIREWSPGTLRLVILVDRPDGFFDPAKEDFEVIFSEDLPIPETRWFHFKYTILEASTAVKPYALEFILEKYGIDRLFYFDPDIRIYGKIDSLIESLADRSIVLTPHLTSPLTDNRRPSDLDILRSGSYNLGFIGIARSSETARFLEWWKTRLYDHCVVDLAKGLFVDQRWIDLVPGLFDGVSILRNPGYNVAYWNLAHRPVTRSGDSYLAAGEPLCFFHFSGFDPNEPHSFSRHQNRFTLDDLGGARELVLDYRGLLLENGYAECKKWPYAFGVFENGFAIPDMGRPAHHEMPDVVYNLVDPFSEEGYRTFVDLWNQPLMDAGGKPSGVTRLAYRIYRARSDVQLAMPDLFGGDLVRFLNWILSSGQAEHGLDSVFVAPIWKSLRSRQSRPAADSARPARPVMNEKILATLAESGIWVSADQAPAQLESLNRLIGNGGARLHLSQLAKAIYESRADLQRFFPDPCGRDSVRFLLWFLTYGAHEYRLDEVLLSPLRKQWNSIVGSLGNPLEKVWYRGVLQVTSRSVAMRKSVVGFRLGSRSMRNQAAQWWSARRNGPAAGNRTRGAISPADGLGVDIARVNVIGVNIIGYLRSEMGVGESVRCAVKAARASALPLALRTVDENGPYRLGDRSAGEEHGEHPYQVNLFHVNADQSELVFERLGPKFTRGKYNIGYWAWELEEFPDRWTRAFRLFDEIWTPSTFCQTAIARKSPIRVLRMPHAIGVDCDWTLGREDFSIPADRFVFLAMFDLMSISERKNPDASIAAFARAFGASEKCHLVLKIGHARERPLEAARIAQSAAGLPVTIIDQPMDRDRVNSLIAVCDCLISLHRSEGFGLSIAEAMYLKKPVIATAYSGNLDFTKSDNSFLVGYDLAKVPPGCSPYDEGSVWAEPRLDDAVRQMRTVFENHELRSLRAERGSDYIRTHFAPEVVGALMRERLELVLSLQRREGGMPTATV